VWRDQEDYLYIYRVLESLGRLGECLSPHGYTVSAKV
jgi:hypothetical protein